MLVWILIAAAAAIFEAISAGLISLWFVAGGIVAAVLAKLGFNIGIQGAAFIIVSVLSIAALRPLIKKSLDKKSGRTNVDRLIGMTALVTENVDNLKNKGEVMVMGQRWSARTTDDDLTVNEGERVEIIDISGVKLIIKRTDES